MTLHRTSVGIDSVAMGRDVHIVEPVNLYGCEIGDGCFIGPFVEIQRNAKIGARTRVQSHTFVCEGVTVGDDCFIGHGVRFVNDRFASGGPSSDPVDWEKTVVGDRVSIGSGAVILPVTIHPGAVIGAGAVVTRDITEAGTFAGNPARKLRSLPDPR